MTRTFPTEVIVFDPLDLEGSEKMLGPVGADDIKVSLSSVSDMAELWVLAGFFKTKTDARRNGHGGPIPKGFTDIVKRKRGIRLTIWNPADDMRSAT